MENARKALRGVDVETLRSDEAFREAVAGRLDVVRERAEKIVSRRAREISLDDVA